ncbi:hypothetical protein [Dactylosporangium sp. NPDC005555]|uniref:hypothetical protein n=1 Tax=Dactylosporangium sp. NPDC005555 TaxID=3154889 RepID=UPI0033B9C077
MKNERGVFRGIYGLVNSLVREGQLTPAERRLVAMTHAWFEAAYTDPSQIDPTVYNRDLHPCAAAWFKPTACHLVDRMYVYLPILSAHGIACAVVRDADPGQIIYEDDHQIVVVPHQPSQNALHPPR